MSQRLENVVQNLRSATLQPAFVLGTAFSLGLFLAGLRFSILRTELTDTAFTDAVALVTWGNLQDWTLVFFISLITLALNHNNSGKPNMRRSGVAFLILGNLMLLLGIVNAVAVPLLGEPLTLAWIRYSDIFHSPNTFDSLLHLLSPGLILSIIAALVGFTGASLLFAMLLNRWLKSGWQAALVATPYTALLISIGIGQDSTHPPNVSGKLTNPGLAFVFSLYAEDRFTPKFALTEGNHPLETAAPSVRPVVEPGQIKNVLFYVLESTPAKYAQGFGGEYPVTPNLLKHASIGRSFTNAYAHAPASNYFLVSLMAAIIPELSSNSMSYSYPDLKLDTLATVLKDNGFRSSFFNSSDNRFQNTKNYMSHSGVETVLDHRDWPCEMGIYESTYAASEYLNTSNDLCTIGPMLDWIKQEPDTPFFAIMRTGMTHYPYFPGENNHSYVTNEDQNRYLNAVRVGDEAFGLVMEDLEKSNILDATLVVVVGDHGEAFGEHGTISHASGIYDENLRVPLMLINPQLFSGSSSDVVVGVYDLAPTVLDILGITAPPSWQGHSVFAEGRPASVLFFTPWNGFQIGFRQGPTKLIYNVNSEDVALYDVTTDPGELNNLIAFDPSAADKAKRTLAQLVRNQNAWIDHLVHRSGNTEPQGIPRSGPRQLTINATGTRFKTPPKARITLDGKEVGHIEITAAPSNADAIASDEKIAAATTSFTFPIDQGKCSRRVEIDFLNDEWEGEGQTGDTDLFIDSVELDGKDYGPLQFELITEDAGGKWGDYFVIWRKGAFWVNLDVGPDCISNDLASR